MLADIVFTAPKAEDIVLLKLVLFVVAMTIIVCAFKRAVYGPDPDLFSDIGQSKGGQNPSPTSILDRPPPPGGSGGAVSGAVHGRGVGWGHWGHCPSCNGILGFYASVKCGACQWCGHNLRP